MANQFRSSESEAYGSISAFYLALWAHLDALSDQSRWRRSIETPPIEARKLELSTRFRALVQMKVDRLLMSSISNEYETTLKLADQFIERSATDVALRNRVEEWKAPRKI